MAREKYNPEIVFSEKAKGSQNKLILMEGNKFQIRWDQQGDFWRDERVRYQGLLKNQCAG